MVRCCDKVFPRSLHDKMPCLLACVCHVFGGVTYALHFVSALWDKADTASCHATDKGGKNK